MTTITITGETKNGVTLTACTKSTNLPRTLHHP